jgi:RNA-splicing ligase RtcB
MPDAHFGMGATVGSVIPTESAIIPAAVGVDIGCGMIATELDLEASALPDSLDPLLHSISRSIPAGFNRRKDATTPAASWMNVNPVPDKSRVPAKPLRKAADQLGTLGGGNHFVEVCLDERERVWAVLHSGSRGIGNVMARGTSQLRRRCVRTWIEPSTTVTLRTSSTRTPVSCRISLTCCGLRTMRSRTVSR